MKFLAFLSKKVYIFLIISKSEVTKNDHIQRSKSKDGRTPEKCQEILEDL